MSEIVTVPSLIMMTLIVFEKSPAKDRHTDGWMDRQTERQTDRQTFRHLAFLNTVRTSLE